jgi:ATP-binding cassette subfamily C (CFTR/MRP) protein 1
MWFFDTTPIGRILNRFARDHDVIDNVLPYFLRNWVLMIFTVIAIFVVIMISTPLFLTAGLPILIVFYVVQKFYIETARQARRMESLTRSPIFAHFAESVSGQSTIRAYQEEKRFIATSETRIDYNHGIAYHVMVANRWSQLNLQLLGSLVVLFASLFAVLGDRDRIDGATAGLSLTYALQLATSLFFLVRVAAEVCENYFKCFKIILFLF